MHVTIRRPQPSDFSNLIGLMYRRVDATTGRREFIRRNSTQVASDLDSIRGVRGFCLVASVNGIVVGFVQVGYSSRSHSLHAEVKQIYVEPDFRRQGIGQELLTLAMKFAKKSKAATFSVHVSPTNAAAIKLYKRNDFRPSTLEMERRC